MFKALILSYLTIHPTMTESLQQTTYIKKLAEAPGLASIPSTHVFAPDSHALTSTLDPQQSIPTIDFSLFTSGTPHQRSKIIHDIGQACQDWGFFILVNHGVSESLMDSVIESCREFFELGADEKKEYEGKRGLEPICCGTGCNVPVEMAYFWRDFVKIIVHPEFHSPDNPPKFRDVAKEFTTKVRCITKELLKGISESLGLESNYIDKAMNMESCFQLMAANLYPPCPQPDLAFGIPAHTDYGLLTLLMQNGIGGLQIKQNGKWFNVQAPPYSFLVNTGDHMEILSNGRYKSVWHRAVVNNQVTRISIAVPHGSSLETVVAPAPELEEKDGRSNFIGMTFKEYLDLKLSNKPCLEVVRVTPA